MTILSATQAVGASAPDSLEAPAPRPANAATIPPAEADRLFQASLDTVSATAAEPKAGAPISAVYRGSKSGELTPVQQFESFVLRSFVETMLPQDNTSFFGTGTAGQIWKSMLAERIGEEMAKDGGIGIAELLSKRDAQGSAAAEAKAALSKTLGAEAKELRGVGSL